MFIVFDGIDGSGKSTQLDRARQWLTSQGIAVTVCMDPGSTGLGYELRRLLLEKSELTIEPMSEMLLFTAARAQLVAEVIRPALAEGRTVLCDRYIFSTVVYQGHAAGLSVDDVWKVNLVAVAGLVPMLTVLFDVPAEIAFQRMGRQLDRMESRGLEFMRRVRQGFLCEADRWPQQVAVIDGQGNADDIEKNVRRALADRMQGVMP